MSFKTKALLLQKRPGEAADSRVKSFIASSEAIDADGDIVEQDFDLKRFKSNPVILYAHQSRELPIGKAIEVGVVDGKLKVDIEFATKDQNPKAEQVLNLINGGMLNALSIGFVPKDVRKEMRDDKEVFVLSKNELHEISVVPIPSNPEALQDAKAKAIKDFLSKTDTAAKGKTENESMNEKEFNELQAKAARLESELGTKTSELKAANDKLEALQTRYDSTEKLYNESKTEASGLREAQSKKRVEDLVGKKIAPCEVDSLVKLSGVDAELFETHIKAIEARPDMLLVEGSGLPTDADENAPSLKNIKKNPGDSSTFADLVKQDAGL